MIEREWAFLQSVRLSPDTCLACDCCGRKARFVFYQSNRFFRICENCIFDLEKIVTDKGLFAGALCGLCERMIPGLAAVGFYAPSFGTFSHWLTTRYCHKACLLSFLEKTERDSLAVFLEIMA